MAQVNLRLPVILNENDILFRQLQILCNNGCKCKKYQEFIKAYEEVSQINLTLAEIGIEEDMIDLMYYEINLGHRFL
ncbi:MAG TPA: hypothetical protein PK083_01715 [Soehngenia sp.]|nr:hypothetical protein [Soehngenia sp.]HPP31159.1 hypothetical protein [Soehngenia sp.]